MKLEQAWETAQKQLQLAKEEETKATANVFNAKESITRKHREEGKSRETVFTIVATSQFCDGRYLPTGKNVRNGTSALEDEIDQF